MTSHALPRPVGGRARVAHANGASIVRRIAAIAGGATLIVAALLLVMGARLIHASRGSIALHDLLHAWVPELL